MEISGRYINLPFSRPFGNGQQAMLGCYFPRVWPEERPIEFTLMKSGENGFGLSFVCWQNWSFQVFTVPNIASMNEGDERETGSVSPTILASFSGQLSRPEDPLSKFFGKEMRLHFERRQNLLGVTISDAVTILVLCPAEIVFDSIRFSKKDAPAFTEFSFINQIHLPHTVPMLLDSIPESVNFKFNTKQDTTRLFFAVRQHQNQADEDESRKESSFDLNLKDASIKSLAVEAGVEIKRVHSVLPWVPQQVRDVCLEFISTKALISHPNIILLKVNKISLATVPFSFSSGEQQSQYSLHVDGDCDLRSMILR